MRTVSCCVLALLLATAPAAAEEKRKIAVLDLVAKTDIHKGMVALLNELLLTEVERTGDFGVLGSSDITSIMTLEEQKVQVTGCSDAACLAEIGGALGVSLLMASSVGAVGDKYLLNIKIVDTSSATVVKRISEVVERNDNKLIAAIKSAVAKVMFPLTGKKPPEPTPVPAADPKASADAGSTSAGAGATTPEATATAEVKQPSKFIEIAPWITLGLAGAAAVVGGVLVGVGMSDYSAMDDEFRKSKAWEDLQDSGDTKLVAGEVMLGVALVAGAGTLVLFLVGGDEETPTAAVVPVRGGAAATVGWTFDLGVPR